MARPAPSKRVSGLWVAVAAVAALLGWRWYVAEADAAAEAQAASAQAQSSPAARSNASPSAAAGPFTAAGLAARQRQLALWQQRYARAEQVYSSYRDATRYPPESRPIDEHPDQVRPFDPVVEELPLRDASGKPVKDLRLRTTQERVFASGAESSRFTIEATDGAGRAVPIQVQRSAAQTIPDSKTLITIVQADVPFSDDGMGADEVAGDGRYSGRLAPAAQGFAAYAGTIRVMVQLSANGEQGVAAFDVVYTPAVPATWAGVREAPEEGGLNFYLKAMVKTAGRYVASARVYDANGVPFALLQFNEEVGAGPAEFKLPLAGALIHDRQPAFPLQLVDVEGFLLRPDIFPDRAMMPRQAGVVHSSRRYDLGGFSSSEWQSEERDRYLAEYGRDVKEALDAMTRLGAR